MATITSPTPGTHETQGVTAGDTLTLAIGSSTTLPIAYAARWQWNLVTAESGSNVGSNLQLQSIADDGFTILATAQTINRATGQVVGVAPGTITGASPQTLNTATGIVTTGTLTTAAATASTYVINNSLVTATSLILVTNQGYSGTLVTNGYPTIFSAVAGSGTITINFANTHAANALNGTLKFGFSVLS